MAWDEWEQLKADAAGQQSTQMRLNQLDDGNGGRGGPGTGGEADLKVNQKSLAAIGDEAHKLFVRLETDGKHAKSSSEKAATGLKADFEVGGALAHVAEHWDAQVRTLLDACAHISNHLEFSNKAHRNDEERALIAFSKISELDAGFDDRDQRR
ncbi:hypothetical protein HRW14_03105 [Streptomyces lunaelactis]|uniref:hypothetical protein n=1 Tax=Streptomyces lunaelactis TaxID=1535768 RepID=UPI00158591F3|nr:hypothetical protein [Streptomyces lunaelactis]NUK21502.1 hypothetical protein [Streptomyces lunaelactis]NUK33545.1 hypothetical protein [Streptomyces lunaelactis]NUK40762.1 hypothetical protein [Streptomyces lunaelactis]NUK49298.1 hypothetical protein [Streptomyces lunaelactis]NUK64092.1 hypothetical protein [Streptomyces lunaelactis]